MRQSIKCRVIHELRNDHLTKRLNIGTRPFIPSGSGRVYPQPRREPRMECTSGAFGSEILISLSISVLADWCLPVGSPLGTRSPPSHHPIHYAQAVQGLTDQPCGFSTGPGDPSSRLQAPESPIMENVPIVTITNIPEASVRPIDRTIPITLGCSREN